MEGSLSEYRKPYIKYMSHTKLVHKIWKKNKTKKNTHILGIQINCLVFTMKHLESINSTSPPCMSTQPQISVQLFEPVTDLYSSWAEKKLPDLWFFKVPRRSSVCGEAYTYGYTVFDGWFPVLSLAVQNNWKSRTGPCGLLAQTIQKDLHEAARQGHACICLSEVLSVKSASSIKSIKKPCCCPIIPLFPPHHSVFTQKAAS